jgi:hypothetical protein
MDILISRISRIRRNTERIFQTLADGGPKAAADQPFQAWRLVSWLWQWQAVTPSKPKQHARFPQVSFRCTFSEYSAQDFDEDSQGLKGRD